MANVLARPENDSLQYLMKQQITMPMAWDIRHANQKLDMGEDIYTHNHQVVGEMETTKIDECQSIIRKSIKNPGLATCKDYVLWFQIVFSLYLDHTGLENASMSIIQAFHSLPDIEGQYEQLHQKGQLTIKTLLYIDRMLTNLSILQQVDVKPLVREAFKLNQNSLSTKDVIRFFNDVKSLARKIFRSANLRQLRGIFYVDFQHFDEITKLYDLFGKNDHDLVGMLMTQIKTTIGLDSQLKRIDPSQQRKTLQQRVEFVSKQYPQMFFPYMLFELSKCVGTDLYAEMKSLILQKDFDCQQVSREVEKLRNTSFIYYLAPQRSGIMVTMQQKSLVLLDLSCNLRVRDQIRCCIFHIAATMMLQSNANSESMLLNAIFPQQKQSLNSILKKVPYCNPDHKQELICEVAKAIMTARQYQPHFLTYRYLTEQVQYRLKVAKIISLKQKMFEKQPGSCASSPSQTVSEQKDLEFVLELDNFKNQAESMFNIENQQLLLKSVGQMICKLGRLGIKKQKISEWATFHQQIYMPLLRTQSYLPVRAQFQKKCYHHIKLTMFSNYCQQSVGQYLNHQQYSLVFNQDIPNPNRIFHQLKRITPHYLVE